MSCLCAKCGRTCGCGEIYCLVCQDDIDKEADQLADGYPVEVDKCED